MTVLKIFFVQTDWPYPMALEGPLDIQGEGLLLGTQDDIAEILRESARILNPDQTNNFACLLLFFNYFSLAICSDKVGTNCVLVLP